MPHGYKCNKCESFVEQEKTEEEHDITMRGREEVHIDNPNEESDNPMTANIYTLCETCRSELIIAIEQHRTY